jgi:peptidoglycan/LPS O-acetylase OafA/YrhL
MSADYNQDHIFSPLQKLYIFACGLVIALGISYITYLYFEYRVEHALWQTTFVSPTEFWAQVPEWKWKPVFEEFKG